MRHINVRLVVLVALVITSIESLQLHGEALASHRHVPGASDSAVDAVAATANLAVTISDAGQPVVAGTNLVYTVTVSNNGPEPAEDVALTYSIPTGSEVVSLVHTQGSTFTVAPDLSSATIDSLAAGNSAEFELTVFVLPSVAVDTLLSGSVNVSSSTNEVDETDNTAFETTIVQTRADVVVTGYAVQNPAVAGTNITYYFTITNMGPSDGRQVILGTFQLAGARRISAEIISGPYRPNPMPPGSSTVMRVIVETDPWLPEGTVLHFMADADPLMVDPNESNNRYAVPTAIITRADLALTKTAPGPVVAGTNLTYTIDVVNNGPSDAQDVVVTDVLPANTTFVSATDDGWIVSSPPEGSPGTVTFSKGTVADGETATFTIKVRIPPDANTATPLVNRATATSSTVDFNPTNNSHIGTAITPVTAEANLSIEKSASSPTVSPGGTITYELTVRNDGPSDARAVRVTDTLPAGTRFVSASTNGSSGWVITSKPSPGGTGKVTFSNSQFVAGAEGTLTITVKVNSTLATGTVIENSAAIGSTINPGSTAKSTTELDPSDNTDWTEVTVVP